MARFLPVSEFTKLHPWPTAAALRKMVFEAERTGFAQCVHRIGRRVLIDEERFIDWVREHGPDGKAASN